MPDTSSRQQSLNRRRQLAAALQQQSMLPLEQPDYPGANMHITQGLAKLAQALVAGLSNRKIDKEQGALDTETSAQRLKLAQAMIPRQTGIQQTMPDPTGGSQTFEQLPGPQDQQRYGAMAQAISSQDPYSQQLGQFDLQQLMRQQEQGRGEAADQQRLIQQQQGQQALQTQGINAQDRQQQSQQGFTSGENALNRAATAANQNIDPLSRAGINAQLELAQTKPASRDTSIGSYTNSASKHVEIMQRPDNSIYERDSNGTVRESAGLIQERGGYDDLSATDKAKIDAVAQKVSAGEYTIANGLTALGGVRGGLGGALTERLSDVRVLPTPVRTANSDIERAKNLMAPVRKLVEEIAKTTNARDKVVKSAQLEQYVNAIGTQFARARGERGVVTDQDVTRVLGLVPGWKAANFAPEYAQENLRLIDEAFNRDQSALLSKYFTVVPGEGGGGAAGGEAPEGTVISNGTQKMIKRGGKWVPQ